MRPTPEDAGTPTEPPPQFAHALTGAVATTPQKSLVTPVKGAAAGQLYYSRQNRTPAAAHPANPHLAHLQVASPHLRTPGSAQKFRTPGSGGSRKGTPRFQHGSGQHVYNPFEAGLLDHLNSPMVSPNVFRTGPGSCEKTPQMFRWSIDQLASLKPVAIEEMPLHQANTHLADCDVEFKAQTAIDNFFENHAVVPSPWTDSAKKKPFKLPRTPGNEMESPATSLVSGPASLGRKEVACQTGLSLPVDFDLQKVLGEYYTQQGAPPTDEANLSSSSLRRKLFFHGDEGTPLSPVKGSKSRLTEAMDLSCLSPLVSPVKHQTPLRTGQLSPFHTPGSAHFSSSPVHQSGCSSSRSMATPGLRRCSTASELVMSPELSPIGSAKGSFSHSEPTSPQHAPWQATPTSGCSGLALHLDSPGMSPIFNGDGSFVTSSVTPQSARSGGRRHLPKRVPTPADLRPCHSPPIISHGSPARRTKPAHWNDLDLSHSMDISGQYFVSPRTSQENPSLELKSAFSEIRESHDESTSQGLCLRMDMLSHDTGYQTTSQDMGCSASLQLTNIGSNSTTEPPSQHCNLTNPFSQLPLPHDAETTETIDESFNEDRIIQKARALLGKPLERTPPEPVEMPKLVQSIGVPAFHWHDQDKDGEQKHYAATGDTRHVLPSELASRVLRRAEEDFARYCGPGSLEHLVAEQPPTTASAVPQDMQQDISPADFYPSQ